MISVALLALAWLPQLPPVLGVALLGLGYACVQNLIWSSVPLATPPYADPGLKPTPDCSRRSSV